MATPGSAQSRRSSSWLGVATAGLVMLLAACTSGPAVTVTTGNGTSAAVAGSPTVTAASAPVSSAPLAVPPSVQTPLVASVLYPPVPFMGSDGDRHLVYELSIVNYSNQNVTVDSLQVLDADSDDVVQTLDQAAVTARIKPVGQGPWTNVLTAAQAGTVFLHIALPADAAVPAALIHRITITADVAPAGANPIIETVAPTTVDPRTVPVLAAPLKGEGYLAADACCDAVRHTRALLAVNGQPFLSQRYAVDWEQIDAEKRLYVGPRADVNSYAIFGDEALAAADGTVVVMVDGLAEQTPGLYPDNIPLPEADGNSVVLDIGNGFFINYAHFQPGSVRVQVGDTVKTGDVLGLVGNTGNSLVPHLHFHVQDGPSPLASQGLPYEFDSFTVTGQAVSTEAFDQAEADGTPLPLVPGISPSEHADEMVLDQNVVTLG